MRLLVKENLFEHLTEKDAIKVETWWYLLETDVRLSEMCRSVFPYGECKQITSRHMWTAIYWLHIYEGRILAILHEYRLFPSRALGLVLCGDLHFNHRYGDTNCYYPGSPVNTTFDRDENRSME